MEKPMNINDTFKTKVVKLKTDTLSTLSKRAERFGYETVDEYISAVLRYHATDVRARMR